MTTDECRKCGAPRAAGRESCPFCNTAYPTQAPAPEQKLVDWEPGWRWCAKCQALFYQSQSAGSCAAGGDHDCTGSEAYALSWDESVTGESGWAWCKKCNVLCYAGNPGTCSAGGAHDHEGSPDYHMNRAVGVQGAVTNYKWCTRCDCMFYAGETEGVCPSGGAHARDDENVYNVFLE